jgi:hypothetical protein
MKNRQNRFLAVACGCAAVLVLGLCLVTLRQAMANCGGCNQTCSNKNEVAFNLAPTSTTALSGDFSAVLCLQWVYTSPPTLGDIAFEPDGTQNVSEENVTYIPSYLVPDNCCSGSVEIGVQGTLDNAEQNGLLYTLGWLWPPTVSDWHELNINAN